MRIGAFLLLLISFCAPAAAQDFTVTATTPDSGSVAVPLQATVSFTFSAPLDTTARFSDPDLPVEFFAISPSDSVQIDRAAVSADRTQLSFEVTHTNDTDFVWILTGAYDADSTLLCRPHVLQYTTADAAGPYSVSGEAEIAVLVKRSTPCDPLRTPMALLWNDFPERGGYVVAAAVAHGDLVFYEIPGVRAGTYRPAAMIAVEGRAYPENPGELNFGYYDPSTQEFVDSLVVADSSRTDIILQGAGPGAARSADVPGVAALLPSYPNPFNPQTTLRFRLERPARVRLAVYDVLGREVAVLREGWLPMGTHEHVWNAAGRASGLYLIRLDAGGTTLSRTALLVR